MSRKVKTLMQDEMRQWFDGVTECVVCSVRGIPGTQNNRMRGELLNKDIRIRVVQNALASRAFADMGCAGIKDVLAGHSAIAYGGDSIVDLVKILEQWQKDVEKFEIKGGFLDGEALDRDATMALAKMPNRAELQGQVVGLALSPGRQIGGALIGPAGIIAGCIKAIADKQEEAAAE